MCAGPWYREGQVFVFFLPPGIPWRGLHHWPDWALRVKRFTGGDTVGSNSTVRSVGMPISAGMTASMPYVSKNGVSPLLDLIMTPVCPFDQAICLWVLHGGKTLADTQFFAPVFEWVITELLSIIGLFPRSGSILVLAVIDLILHTSNSGSTKVSTGRIAIQDQGPTSGIRANRGTLNKKNHKITNKHSPTILYKMSQPANDEFSQHLSDDEESNHEDASDTGVAPKQQQQVIPQTTAILNIKLPILKKEEYDIWAMEMEHYLRSPVQ
ncbi:hypothetical protein Tco_1320954 [Tanacetum coccineum]